MAAALEKMPGVNKVEVSLLKGQARVEFDDAKTSSGKMVEVIDLLGYKARLLHVAPAS